MMGLPGPSEWVVIAGIALLLFGASRIPEVFRSFGEGIREFKKAVKDEPDERDRPGG